MDSKQNIILVKDKYMRRIGTAAVLFIAVTLFACWTVVRVDREMRSDLLRQTRLVARMVNLDSLKTLTGSGADLTSPEYVRLKEQLATFRSANPQCRFVYLMGRKADGMLYFLLDSEPVGSRDYSPPGQLYGEAPSEYRRVFDTRTATVEGPDTDRWGTWVTALVPLTNPQTSAVVAVMGMDIDALTWKWNVATRAALPVGLVLVLFIGFVTANVSTRRVDSSPKPVLRRLLPSLSVMAILLVGGLGALLYHQYRQQLTKDIAADLSDAYGDLRMALDQQVSGLGLAVRPIATDPGVIKALRDGNADHLLTRWRSVFESLNRENHLTHFYFLDKNRVCLLRVHMPEKSGDRIERFTALEAQRTGKAASGIELGPLGTLTLRVVQPVFEGGMPIGYVELGKEIEDVLQALRIRSGSQLVVVIRKEYLKRQAWEDGMRLFGRKAEWDRLPRNVVIYSSQGRLPNAFASWADHFTNNTLHGEMEREFASDGKFWRVTATPLPDATGKEIGVLLVTRDISTEKRAFADLMILGGTGGTVLLALLLSVIYILLRRTDSGIRAQQEALRESEQSYRNQFVCNAAVMLLIDPTDASIVDANQAAVSFYGYQRERLLTMRITDINTLPASEVRQFIDSVSQGRSARAQFQHRLVNGSLRDVEVSASSIQFVGRTVLHTIVQDISERVRAEEELKGSSQRYERLRELLRNIADVIPDMVWAKDLDRKFIFVNKAVCDGLLCARDTDEPIGKTDMFFVERERNSRPDNPHWHTFGEICIDSDAAVLESGTTGQFDESGNVRGRFLALEVIKSLLRDETGKIIGTVGSGRDVTARKRTEEALARSQVELKIIYDNAPVMMCLVDTSRRVLYANSAFTAFTDVHESDLIGGQTCDVFGCIYALDDPRGCGFGFNCPECVLRLAMEDTFKTGIGHHNIEHHTTLIRNGVLHDVTLLGSIAPIPVDDRNLLLLCLLDITEHKRVEEEKFKLQVQLQQSQKMEMVGQLAGGVAHDFNNMLNVITGYTELSLMKMDSSQPLFAYLTEILKAAERSANLTRQLLGFARKQTVAPQVIDLNETVADMLKMLQRLIGEDIELRLHSAADLWPVYVDPSQIDQILANLCVNARDAISGVGKMTIETENSAFDEEYCAVHADFVPGDFVRLSVSDNGCGMAKETLEHIFEPFFTTKETGKGTGLGLATVYGIVRQNNGFINVYSEPGQGTTFTIYLPRHMGTTGQSPHEILAPPVRGNETILFVEDESSILQMTTKMLEMQGYVVLAAGTPDIALGLAKEHSGEIHLLLTDVVMPEMNGRELSTKIQALYPDLACLFMSGYSANVIAHHGVLDEGVHFIQKPFSMQNIATKVREALDGKPGNQNEAH
ncbi:MAG: PAS domain S-box protein [Desulfuromonadales bacterium]|nr:PAS domain S-box protein [Desulfuromonadales bacterium]